MAESIVKDKLRSSSQRGQFRVDSTRLHAWLMLALTISTGVVDTLAAPGIIEAGRLEVGDSPVPVKYTDELKARAVELVIHAQADPETANRAIIHVANELVLSKETSHVWGT